MRFYLGVGLASLANITAAVFTWGHAEAALYCFMAGFWGGALVVMIAVDRGDDRTKARAHDAS